MEHSNACKLRNRARPSLCDSECKPDEMELLAADLKDAWRRYQALFGEDPHGTECQMKALLALTRRYGAKMPQSDAKAEQQCSGSSGSGDANG